ncbi:hypothetical protein VC83_01843 [Pseudogymnoascus destructans]|uniref:Uncharacterized protein n=1 Tax=Pseudogymnoascus destructans TaxID=655981 RepID=A0A177AIP4_9PEZI|nr:uncharacterized protein VC83_01843 [Pseudogymnoascus destructans]OAF61660.2 hypothetical protein VC83_01843 [Pseudogymnoascus destructans]
MNTPPNSPRLSPLGTLEDIARAVATMRATWVSPPFLAVSGEESIGNTNTGEKTSQAYRTVTQVDGNASKYALVNELQPISTPDRTILGSTIQRGTTIKAKISDTIYSQQTLNMLNKLFGARLCAGMENKVVQDVVREVHGMMTPEQHLVLCLGAWQFEANRIRLLSHPWEHFYRFAFMEPGIGKCDLFAGMARSWNSVLGDQKTAEEITAMWQDMITASS